jgi:cytoskeletal protein CcmA (bactofilin family)
MGIFGRDETTPEQQPVGATARPSPTAAPDESADRTFIARPSKFEGRLTGSGEIIVNGSVNGIIDGSGTVRIADQGRVEANVHGKTVKIAGTVAGDITADERIELEPSARVDGNITAPRILIQDGASFKGQVNMKEPAKRPDVKTSSARKTPEDPSTP